ncbi:MAG: hypothetical protein GY796_33185, partial [Chloroflexi bacterium]|nr:hypothetical protein [Chloroflexota bacterium]
MNQENKFTELVKQLSKWNGRRRRRDMLLWLPRGLLAGLLLAVVVAALARYRPLLTNREVGIIAIIFVGMGLLAAFLWLLWQRHTLQEQAHFADGQFQLQERASTAVQIHNNTISAPSTLTRQQLNDTLTAVQRVDTKSQLPLQINRQDWLIILLGVTLLLLAILLPNLQEETLLQQRDVTQSIEEQAAQLEALSQQIQQNPDLTNLQKEELLQPVQEAIQGLGEGDVSQEQGVAALSEAEAELRDLAAQNSNEALHQQLETAGEPLTNNANSQSLGENLQNGNLTQAAAAASQLADELPSLTAAEQQALAQDLMETAQALVGTDDQLAQQLAEAAQALQNGDVAAAQQALRDAAGTLQQRAQEGAAADQANQAANALAEGRQSVAQAGQGEGQSQPPANPDNLLPPNDGRANPNQNQGLGEIPGPGQGDGNGQGQGPGQGQGNEQGGELGGP